MIALLVFGFLTCITVSFVCQWRIEVYAERGQFVYAMWYGVVAIVAWGFASGAIVQVIVGIAS